MTNNPSFTCTCPVPEFKDPAKKSICNRCKLNVLSADEIVERSLRLRHQHLEEELTACEKEIEAHFFPRIKKALEAKDIEAAKAIWKKMPSDTVAKCFGLDMIREAEKA